MNRQNPGASRALHVRIDARIAGVIATTLGLVLSLAVSAAFSQQPQTHPTTDAYGVNAGAQFPEPPPSALSSEPTGDDPRARILRWNEIAMAATALDHTPPQPGDPRVFREQFGPGREAKALAIVQIAVFDAGMPPPATGSEATPVFERRESPPG